jgi:hypothetical protein
MNDWCKLSDNPNQCGMSRYVDGRTIQCADAATWQHPRWPNGGYCAEHYARLKEFYPDGWTPFKPAGKRAAV